MATYTRALVVINPASGRHDPSETRRTIEDRLQQHGIPFDVRETQQEGDALMWAQQAASNGFDLVVVSGGDGTIMEAMSGLIKDGSRVPLLQIPVGTANLLARALSIPIDQAQALDLAVDGKAVRLDVGYLPDKDRYFALIAGAGYDAQLIADASRELKNVLGFAAYVYTGLKNLFALRRSRITIEIDGRRRRVRAHTVMIVNVGSIDHMGISIGPKLDLMIISSASIPGALRILFQIVTRQFSGNADLQYLSASRVRVDATPPLPTQIDGEELGTTPLIAEAIPRGALLIVPTSYKTEHAEDADPAEHQRIVASE
jgi:diacylglycerol kinase (ATP)